MKKWSGFLGKPHLGHSDFWTLPLINRGPCSRVRGHSPNLTLYIVMILLTMEESNKSIKPEYWLVRETYYLYAYLKGYI